MPTPFSVREGHTGDANNVLIRDDAPVDLRRFLLELPQRGHVENHDLQKIRVRSARNLAAQASGRPITMLSSI